MELLKELLQHPLFISLFISIITILFGKFLILDKILPGKIVDLKINTINKVVELKNLMKDVKLYYNRMINTLKLSENREYWPEGRKGYQQGIISSETQKISELINDIIPKKSNYIDTDIELFFNKDNNTKNALENYNQEFKKIHDFVQSGEIFQKGFDEKMLWQEIPELKLEALQKAENLLVKSIKRSKTIHKYGYK